MHILYEFMVYTLLYYGAIDFVIFIKFIFVKRLIRKYQLNQNKISSKELNSIILH